MIRPHRSRLILLGIVMLVLLAAALWVGPLAQPPEYHAFADQRALLGLPNAANVLSNLAFLLVGVIGLRELRRPRLVGGLPQLRQAYTMLFVASALLAFGSGYYHLAPGNDGLFLDRLPMALGFASFATIVIGERIDPGLAKSLLWLLVALSLASVLWWWLGERSGRGDLRPYVLVQFGTVVLLPLVLLMYRTRLVGGGWHWAVLGCYVLAKLCEEYDARVFDATGWISGHTLKHLVAAGGIGLFVLALRRRRRVGGVG